MLSRKTVLILGAGASTDYGFPTGSRLIDEIWYDRLTMETQRWFPLLNECGFSNDDITNFRETLHRADPPSVDDFLAIPKNDSYREIGKTVMALALIQHETISAITRAPDAEGVTKLYTFLWHHMGTNVDDFTASAHRLTIVTFNYDRSLEYYLYQSLSNQFGDEKEAITAIRKLRIIHVYGTLCPPHFLDGANGRIFSNFTDKPVLERCRNNMHLVYEKDRNSRDFEEAHNPFRDCERVCFLGFRYASDNVDRLRLRTDQSDNNKFYGTACGISPNERAEIQNLIPGITLGDASEKCVEFLNRVPIM